MRKLESTIFKNIKLNAELKSWLYFKLKDFFEADQYFSHVVVEPLLVQLELSLWRSATLYQLLGELEDSGIDNQFKLSRKRKKDDKPPAFFEYPRLSTQILSLLFCWGEIKEIQKRSGENIEKAIMASMELPPNEESDHNWEYLDTGRSSYGNKPNLKVSVPTDSGIMSLEAEQQSLLFSLNVDFRFEYNSFRKKVVDECEEIAEKEKKDTDILYIQSDIVRFFHSIDLVTMKSFVKSNFRFAEATLSAIDLLIEDDYKYLPIGWVLSRFLANSIIQKFHIRIKNDLNRKVKNSLGNAFDRAPKFHRMLSYVDDLVFIVTIPKSLTDIDGLSSAILQSAEDIINETFSATQRIRVHKSGSKVKVYRLNRSKVPVLKSNFVFLKTGDGYFDDDLNIRLNIADLFMPADGEMILSETGFFREYLIRIKELILMEDYKSSDALKETLKTIKVKAEGEGARYIRSIIAIVGLILRKSELETLHSWLKKSYLPELVQQFIDMEREMSDYLKMLSALSNMFDLDDPDIERETNYLLNTTIDTFSKECKDNKLFLILWSLSASYKWGAKSTMRKVLSEDSDFLKTAIQQFQAELKILDGGDFFSNRCLMHGGFICLLRRRASRIRRTNIYKKFLSYHSVNKRRGEAKFELISLLSNIGEDVVEVTESLPADLDISKDFDCIIKQSVWNEDIISEIIFSSDVVRLQMIDAWMASNGSIPPVFYYSLVRAGTFTEFCELVLSTFRPVAGRSYFSWFSTAEPLRTGYLSYKIILNLRDKKIRLGDESTADVFSYSMLRKNIKNVIESKKLDQSLEKFFGTRFKTVIDIDIISSDFRNEKIFDKEFKVTLCPITIDHKNDLDHENGFVYHHHKSLSIEQKIDSAFLEARKQKSSMIVFPELAIPKEALPKFLNMAGELDMVMIAGVEYFHDHRNKSFNTTVISIPIKKRAHPAGQNYIAFLQQKNFPAAEEKYFLERTGYNYQPGRGVFIFKSQKWSDFSVLTCSDYLSLSLRWLLQGDVQTVFVPAQNIDTSTYEHISETCLRDLHAISIVCNNAALGSSFCYAPFYKIHERTLFSIEGISKPEFHTFVVNPSEFKNVQENADAQFPFRKPSGVSDKEWKKSLGQSFEKYKQLPPDWKYWKV